MRERNRRQDRRRYKGVGASARHDERGFALLLVFLMASMIAISLYMELPRVAFQAERQKEQLLMERGMQYKRAIGLFLRTNKNTRWPASIDELESFNNHRSLRKRYIDPMTGKDEWRLIHIQNGVLVDSVTNKKPNATTQAGLQPTGFISEIPSMGSSAGGTQAVNPGLRRRPSDGGAAVGPDGQPIPGGAGDPNAAGSYPAVPPPFPGGTPPALPPGAALPGVPGLPTGVPNGAPGTPGVPSGIAGVMGIPPGGSTGLPGQTNTSSSNSSGGLMGGFGGLSGGGLTGGGSTPQPTVPGAPPQGFPGGGAPAQNGVPGSGQPGGVQINPSAQAAAAGLLQNLLTQPRPGGLQGLGAGSAVGTVMGGGIAGVASKAKGQSIMVYGDRTDFSEWEFIYDPTKFQVQNPNTGNGANGPGVPASSLANNSGMSAPGTPIGTGPGGTQASTFGAGGGMPAGFGATGATSAAFGAGGSNPTGLSMGGGSFAPAGSSSTPSSNGAPPSGSAAFGQPGLNPDIRPGKK